MFLSGSIESVQKDWSVLMMEWSLVIRECLYYTRSKARRGNKIGTGQTKNQIYFHWEDVAQYLA